MRFAKGDLIRVQSGWSNYGREAGLYLVLEPGLPRPLWAPPGRTRPRPWASEEWIKILRLETGQIREDVASVYEAVTKGKGKSP